MKVVHFCYQMNHFFLFHTPMHDTAKPTQCVDFLYTYTPLLFFNSTHILQSLAKLHKKED